jgi:preprotein translocase subunit SecE
VDDVADGNAVQDRRDSRGDDRGRTSPATFLRQVVAELRKVVWPTQQQLITYFFVVLVFVVVVMAIVTLLDLAFGKLVFEVFTGSNTQ